MCIIGYAPKGKTISDERLKTMFRNNPHGAGIMWKPNEGPVEIRKGFMDIKSFLEVWHTVPTDCEKAAHFRIASSGKINPENCHPFPIRQDIEALTWSEDEEFAAVMHNGIIPFCEPRGDRRNAEFSDTMIFTSNILANIEDLNNPKVDEMLERQINNSRLLIFQQDRPTIILGHWQKDDGCLFSNGTYRDWVTAWPQSCKGKVVNLPAPPVEPFPVKSTVFDDIDDAQMDDSFWDDIFYGKY